MAQSDQPGTMLGDAASAGDVNGDGYADVLVSATGYDAGQIDEGAVVLYLGSAAGLPAFPDWGVASNQPGARFGRARSAGDVDGDGYDDVVASAASWNAGEGAAFLYRGTPAGPSRRPAWTAQPQGVDVAFATGAGDVNGDGFDDVIVAGDRERVLLYLGSARGLAPSPVWVRRGDGELDFAWIVGPAGDVNGDGFDDVLIASRMTSATSGVSVFLGGAAGPEASPAWTVIGPAGSDFGWSAAAAGDVNGDGFGDLAVGAPSTSEGEVNEGAASVYLGSPSGLSVDAAWRVTSDQAFSDLGFSIASAGDVDGDGFDDLVVGVVGWDGPARDEGQVRVYRGSAEGLGAEPAWTAESGQSGASLGATVAGAGDVDGDGLDDVLGGAWRWDGGQTDEGAVFLFAGRP